MSTYADYWTEELRSAKIAMDRALREAFTAHVHEALELLPQMDGVEVGYDNDSDTILVDYVYRDRLGKRHKTDVHTLGYFTGGTVDWGFKSFLDDYAELLPMLAGTKVQRSL
jgi:hypothetical protein